MEDVDWILWSESADAELAWHCDLDAGRTCLTFDAWLVSWNGRLAYWEVTV